MSSVESIGVAVFLMLVVFFALFCLWFAVRVFSFIVSKLEKPSVDKTNTEN